MIIAALGGITVGITLASLMGNEKAKQVLRSMGTSLAELSGKVVNDLGGYKQLRQITIKVFVPGGFGQLLPIREDRFPASVA
jgi:hypothetical protein